MSHTDAYYAIGKSHIMCQDVAHAGDVGGTTQYALVCDGCSSSPRTELGAQLLASAFVGDLKNGCGEPARHRQRSPAEFPVSNTMVMGEIIERASALARLCSLPSASVDATLLSAVVRDGRVSVDVWGDGAVYWRGRGGPGRRGTEHLLTVEFPSGAPAYPSYLLSDTRRAAYRSRYGDFVRTVTSYTCDSSTMNQWEAVKQWEHRGFSLNLDVQLRESLHDRSPDLICLFSDGIGSFQHFRGARSGPRFEPVPAVEVVPYLVGFKNYAGSFVTRRVRRFLTDECHTLGWHHDDDLAVAAIKLDDDIASEEAGQ